MLGEPPLNVIVIPDCAQASSSVIEMITGGEDTEEITTPTTPAPPATGTAPGAGGTPGANVGSGTGAGTGGQPGAPAVSGPTMSPDMVKASVNGKYYNLLTVISVPDDRGSYGDFDDWGYYSGTSYAGYSNLPAGYWVYVYPNWYIWGNQQ